METESDTALENEIQLTELITPLDDGLVGNEYPAVELRREIADELFTTLHADVSILVLKDVLEVIKEWLFEQLRD